MILCPWLFPSDHLRHITGKNKDFFDSTFDIGKDCKFQLWFIHDLFLFSLGVPCEFFWELCDRIKNCGLLPSNGITIPGKIALFLIRQRQGTSFKFLQDLLLMNRDILSDTYYEVLFCYKSLYNHQYTIWNNRYMSLQSKDELYQAQFLNFEKVTNKFVQNLDFYKNYKTFCDI